MKKKFDGSRTPNSNDILSELKKKSTVGGGLGCMY